MPETVGKNIFTFSKTEYDFIFLPRLKEKLDLLSVEWLRDEKSNKIIDFVLKHNYDAQTLYDITQSSPNSKFVFLIANHEYDLIYRYETDLEQPYVRGFYILPRERNPDVFEMYELQGLNAVYEAADKYPKLSIYLVHEADNYFDFLSKALEEYRLLYGTPHLDLAFRIEEEQLFDPYFPYGDFSSESEDEDANDGLQNTKDLLTKPFEQLKLS